jgi:hypothetical protein
MSDDAEDIDALEAQLSVAQTRVTAQRARLQRFQNKLLAAVDARSRGSANAGIEAASAALAKAASRVRALQMQLHAARNRGDECMREDQPTATTLSPPGKDFALTVFKSGGLRIGGRTYRNGEEIDPALIAGCANTDALLRNYLRWRPRSQLFPPPKAPAPALPIAPAAAPVRDLIDPMLDEVERLAAKRRCSPGDVFDVVNPDVRERAIKCYVDLPKTINSGAFGSGGGMPVASGIGTNRRISDGFEQYLLQRLAARKQAA